MKNKIFMLTCLFLLILTINVCGFAVSTHYYRGKPLVLEPGETINIRLKLQNMVGSTDVNAMAEITEGSDIAKIIDKSNEYFVPAGTSDTKVNIEVSMPKDAKLNEDHSIHVHVKTIPTGGKGTLQIGTGMTTRIPVEVRTKEVSEEQITITQPVSEEKPSQITAQQIPFTTICFTLIVIVLIVVFYLIYKKDHEK